MVFLWFLKEGDMSKEFVQHLREFLETEARSCSMDKHMVHG